MLTTTSKDSSGCGIASADPVLARASASAIAEVFRRWVIIATGAGEMSSPW